MNVHSHGVRLSAEGILDGQDYVMASMMTDTSLDPDELITEFLAVRPPRYR